MDDNRLQTVRAKYTRKLHNESTLSLGHMYERLDIDDYHNDGFRLDPSNTTTGAYLN